MAGQCDGWSSDASQLAALRSAYPDGPDALVILPEVFSKEPLAPAVLDGDTDWAQAVNWAVIATIQAEEWGITQANVDDVRANTEDPNIAKWFGTTTDDSGNEIDFDPGLGLPVDFNYQVIKQVGNYAEIYERHITALGIERGINSLWNVGGMLYAPPYR